MPASHESRSRFATAARAVLVASVVGLGIRPAPAANVPQSSSDRLIGFAGQLAKHVKPVREESLIASFDETIQMHVQQLPRILGRAQSLTIPAGIDVDLDRLAAHAVMTPEELVARADMLDRLAWLMSNDPVARSLARRYRKEARVLLFGQTDIEHVREQCRRIAELLGNDVSRVDPLQREEVAQLLGWLESRGVAPNWIQQVRRRINHANVAVQINGTLALRRLQTTRPVSRPVRDVILGAKVNGLSRGVATITPLLLPHDDSVALTLNLESSLQSRTTSRKDAAKVWSNGTTRLSGNKYLELGPSGARTSPSQVSGTTQAQIVDFEWDRIIGRKIALREAKRSQPQANRIAAYRAARRAEREFDLEVSKQLAQMNKAFVERVVVPLNDRQVAGGRWHLRSTSSSVQLAAVLATPNQPAAVQPFRGFPTRDGNHLMIHESAINNLVQSRWSGVQFDEEQWVGRLESIPGLNLPSLQVNDPDRTWKLRFDEQRPVSVRFDKNRIDLVLRVLEFVVGDDVYPGLEIQVGYQIETDQLEWQVRRDGRLRLSSLADQASPLGVRSQVFRSLVRKRFEPVFEQEIDLPVLLGRFPILNTLMQSGLEFSQIETRDRWLTISAETSKGLPNVSSRIARQ